MTKEVIKRTEERSSERKETQLEEECSMKNWKKAIALIASMSALVSVAACGSASGASGGNSGKKVVGFVAVGAEGGFRTANENDIQTAFKDAGFDLRYSPTTQSDQQKQIQAFNKFVNDEVDAIILSSTEDSGWDDSLKKAAEAEIPVFTVDRDVDVQDAAAKKAIVSHIGPSNEWCGQQAAEFLNKQFPDGGNGLILEGIAGLSVVKDRQTGFDEKIASNQKVLESQSANWSTDEAKTVTAGLLDKYTSQGVNWIWAQNDEMALGAAQAVDAAGLKGKVTIIGNDGTKAALQAVADGELAFDIEYNPIFGKETAQAVQDYLDGKDVEPNIEIESKTFTKEEAQAALDSGERQY
nr:ABC transporter substrate-binding protein [Bifidobacterium miconis]